MRFVYILEDDPKFQNAIIEGILNVDPKIQIRLFSKLEMFAEWVKTVMQKGPAAISIGGEIPSGVTMEPVNEEEHKLVAVISKVEFLGVKQMALLKKTRDLFVKQKICTNEDPTAFVLTAFEEPTFKLADLENRILNNVIMKPFDKLILTQHLTFAIDGRHPPSKYTIANQKTTAIIEMLKDVKMDSLSEIGFVTQSEQFLDGKVKLSKYYGKSFASETKGSLMALLNDCKPDPNKQGEFICSFSYFGLSPSQITALRKKIRGNQDVIESHWEHLHKKEQRASRPIGIVIIDEVAENSVELIDHLKRKFTNLNIVSYKSYGEMMYDLDPKLADSEAEENKATALPSGAEVFFVFDPTGMRLIEFAKAPEAPALQLFGKPEKEIIQDSGWWQTHLGKEQLKKWKEWVAAPKKTAFVLEVDSKKYYLNPGSIDKDPKTKKLKIGFKELSTDEKYQFLIENSHLPQAVDAMLVSHRYVQYSDAEKWNRVKELLRNRATKVDVDLKTQVMVMASRDYLDQEVRELSLFVSDIFYRPMDRGYLCQKLKFMIPELGLTKEKIDFPSLPRPELIQTAMPVQISEISEAGLIMQYYRSIHPGEFRNFVLWTAYELQAPKTIATCNFTEPSSDKEIHNNHFVFFGVTDNFLKAVRIWIRDNYISSKDKGS